MRRKVGGKGGVEMGRGERHRSKSDVRILKKTFSANAISEVSIFGSKYLPVVSETFASLQIFDFGLKPKELLHRFSKSLKLDILGRITSAGVSGRRSKFTL